jgi:large subunit ribosomal protein L11
MAKKIKTIVKLQCPAGKANPAPPVGTALGPQGVNIMEFCNQFNEKTKQMGDTIIPAEVTIYEDRTFSLILKQPPMSILIKKAAGIEKGSGVPNRDKVGKITVAQAREIAEKKMPDLNVNNMDSAVRVVEGTARSMGVTVTK